MSTRRAWAFWLVAVVCVTATHLARCGEPDAVAGASTERRMAPTSDITPREKRVLAALKSGADDDPPNGVVREGRTEYMVRNLEFVDAEACQAFDIEGVTVFNRFDRFADVFIPADFLDFMDAIGKVRAARGFVWDEFAGRVVAPPPPTGKRTTTRAVADPIVRGGALGLTGKGTLFVVLDTGVDFFNPDFITYDKNGEPTTRLRCYWDTVTPWHEGAFGDRAPISYPNGTSLGTVYSHDDLNESLRSAKPHFSSWDTDGHGTACAGIAAGNGNSSDGRYTGVAPDAEIIAVRLGSAYEHGYLINAICDWVDKLAGETPVVFSCSFGARESGHDGMLIEERQLSARFPVNIKRRAICIAAGNEGYRRDHADLSFKGRGDAAELAWQIDSDGYINVYFDSDDANDLAFSTPLGISESGELNKITGSYVAHFEVPAGSGKLELYSRSGKKVTADAYLLSYAGTLAGGFDEGTYSQRKKIISPGAASNVITVGSYDWNDQFDEARGTVSRGDPMTGDPLVIGALSGYSAAGPQRASDVVKPDIVGPGQYFTAPAARNLPVVRDTTGWYRLFNGTSAATPYVAGVVCLIMEKRPDITLGEIKQLLKESATQDRQTGALPNPQWGHGKLNLPAVERLLKRLD